MINKLPLVLWSGGTDSTALVIDLLSKSDIDLLYVNLENNRFQQYYEKKSILKMKSILNDSNLKGKIKTCHSFGYEQINISKSIYSQPALWLTAASFIANPEIHSSVNLAYIRQDDAWHYKTEMHKFWSSIHNLTSDGKNVPLVFPFEWHTKKNMIDIIKNFEYGEQILNLIYWCESGHTKNCGECASCLRHQQDLN